MRRTLRRCGALLALAGLVLPGVAAGRTASPTAAPDPAWRAAIRAALPAGTPPLPLGDPWVAIVTEPAPPGAPVPPDGPAATTAGTAPAVPPTPADPAPVSPGGVGGPGGPGPGVDVDPAPAPPAPPAGAAARASADGLVPAHREYLRPVLARYAEEHRLPADLVMALAWKESSWRAGVVSSAGAIGLMQLMPATVEFTSRTLLGLSRNLDPRDAAANVRMGTRFLRHLVDRNGGSYRQALVAYNQGLTSLRSRGAYADAERFADEVLALRAHFRP